MHRCFLLPLISLFTLGSGGLSSCSKPLAEQPESTSEEQLQVEQVEQLAVSEESEKEKDSERTYSELIGVDVRRSSGPGNWVISGLSESGHISLPYGLTSTPVATAVVTQYLENEWPILVFNADDRGILISDEAKAYVEALVKRRDIISYDSWDSECVALHIALNGIEYDASYVRDASGKVIGIDSMAHEFPVDEVTPGIEEAMKAAPISYKDASSQNRGQLVYDSDLCYADHRLAVENVYLKEAFDNRYQTGY